MTRMLLSLTTLLAATLAPVASSPAQEVSAVVPAEKLEIAYYVPTALSIDEMQQVAQQLFGETIQLAVEMTRSDGGHETGLTVVPHFVVLGETLLLRDTSERANKMIETLKKLEQVEADRRARRQSEDERAEKKAMEEEAAARRAVPAAGTYVFHEFRPRYVDFRTLEAAFSPFQRQVMLGQEDGTTLATMNITSVPESSLLVVCEGPERMKSLEQLADRVDRPQPQVTISATLVRTSDRSDVGGGLPKELIDNLKQMVPFTAFEPISVGLLRASLPSRQNCELRMDLSSGGFWSLSFLPRAWNPETGEITLDDCHFLITAALPGRNESTQEFSTSLTIKSGEYVVLGGVGATPTFVVLRAVLQARSN